MARKDKHKNKPADDGAGALGPGNGDPVGVPGTPGEHDGNGDSLGAVTDPDGASAGDGAPPVDVQPAPEGGADADTPPEAPEPVTVAGGDVDSGAASDPSGASPDWSLEADAGTPPADRDAPAGATEGKRKKKRYATRAAKDERNRKEKERRERKAAERAGQVARATGVASRAARAKDAPEPAAVAAALVDVSGVDMAVLLGLSFHALSMAVPERFGGGALTPEERDLLGKTWAVPLAPYLKGAAGPWAMAAIATVQVFAVRAMTYQPPKPPAPVHSRPSPDDVRRKAEEDGDVFGMSLAADRAVARAKGAGTGDASAATETPKGTTEQEPGVGEG